MVGLLLPFWRSSLVRKTDWDLAIATSFLLIVGAMFIGFSLVPLNLWAITGGLIAIGYGLFHIFWIVPAIDRWVERKLREVVL